MKYLLYFLVITFALSACKSVDKLYQEGNYKQILSKLEGKAKKGKLDRKERSMMARALNKYAQEINSEVETSMAGINPSEWMKAKRKLVKLDEKINEVKSYSQIRDSEIDPSRLDELMPQLNDKLYDHTINEYDRAIASYEKTNDRDYAMKAYAHAQNLYDYDGDTVLIDSLSQVAVNLGHRTVYVRVDGPIGDNFDFRRYFEDELDLNDDVFTSFTDFFSSADYDLLIEVDIDQGDRDRGSHTDRYTKQVVDYYETVVDSNGTTQVPVYKDIEAVVETVEVFLYVEGEYEYEIRDNRNGRRFDYGRERNRVEHSEIFHYLQSGDEQAVPSNIRISTNSNWESRDMLDELKESFYRQLAREFNSDVNLKNRLH